MKTCAAFLLLLVLTAFRPVAVSYHALPASSRITWTGYAEVGGYAPSGTVQLRQGAVEYDAGQVRAARFEFDMRTIQHEQAALATHLRGPDFFDAAQFPTAVFELRALRNGQATGQLTLHGVTRPVQFPATLAELPNGHLRLRGTATLDRTAFGVNYNSSSFFQNLGSYAIRNDFQLAFDVEMAQ